MNKIKSIDKKLAVIISGVIVTVIIILIIALSNKIDPKFEGKWNCGYDNMKSNINIPSISIVIKGKNVSIDKDNPLMQTPNDSETDKNIADFNVNNFKKLLPDAEFDDPDHLDSFTIDKRDNDNPENYRCHKMPF